MILKPRASYNSFPVTQKLDELQFFVSYDIDIIVNGDINEADDNLGNPRIFYRKLGLS